MQSVLIILVGGKEEAKVAKVINNTIWRKCGISNLQVTALRRTRWSRPGNFGHVDIPDHSRPNDGHDGLVVSQVFMTMIKLEKCSSLEQCIVLSLDP